MTTPTTVRAGHPELGRAPRRRPRILLVTCCSALFITSLDNTIVNVGLPTIGRDLHAGVSGLQWIVAAYTLVLASFLLLAGSLGDRFGRRRMFRAGLTIFGVGSLMCGFAPNLPSLIVLRAVQAIGGAMLQPNALSTITGVFVEPRERARAIGVWAAVFGASAAAGPMAGGLLVGGLGWRWVFWVNLPIVAAAYGLSARVMPETRSPDPRRLDGVGQVLVVAALAPLTYAIIEGPSAGWGSPGVVLSGTVGAIALAAFVAVERRRAQPLLDVRLFASPRFAGAIGIAVLAFMILSGFLFLNTLYLQDARGDAPVMAGLLVLPATAVIVVVSPLTGRLVARRGPRLPLTAAGIALTAGPLVLVHAAATAPYCQLAAGYLLFGIGFGLVNPPITNIAVAAMPAARAGVASAVATSSRQIGNVLGVAVIGSLVTIDHPHVGWYLLAGCGAAILTTALATTPRNSRLPILTSRDGGRAGV
ncbi:MFS transporter [Frankia gtarii]|uniref:MFS transporter n=1 Tax=Frankia gtarii TaxID=2950102 RepID=UPI0021C1F2CA|nr:MFS transporter [Frankia gtarii]